MNDAMNRASGAERSVVLFIATSIDGYIARQDGGIEWLSMVESEGEDYGYSALMERVDTAIFGRRTFAQVTALGYDPNSDKDRYVMSRSPVDHDNVTGWSDTPKSLIDDLRTKPGKDIWVVGGANVADGFLEADLVDEITLSVIPLMLGSGIPLFMSGRPESLWELDSTESFQTGLVNLNYKRERA